EEKVRDHRPSRPRGLPRPHADHRPPEKNGGPEKGGVFDFVPLRKLEREIVQAGQVPHDDRGGECETSEYGMNDHAPGEFELARGKEWAERIFKDPSGETAHEREHRLSEQ